MGRRRNQDVALRARDRARGRRRAGVRRSRRDLHRSNLRSVRVGGRGRRRQSARGAGDDRRVRARAAGGVRVRDAQR
eukprot:25178-Pelagococcus_subviridis.AAC.1